MLRAHGARALGARALGAQSAAAASPSFAGAQYTCACAYTLEPDLGFRTCSPSRLWADSSGRLKRQTRTNTSIRNYFSTDTDHYDVRETRCVDGGSVRGRVIALTPRLCAVISGDSWTACEGVARGRVGGGVARAPLRTGHWHCAAPRQPRSAAPVRAVSFRQCGDSHTRSG